MEFPKGCRAVGDGVLERMIWKARKWEREIMIVKRVQLLSRTGSRRV